MEEQLESGMTLRRGLGEGPLEDLEKGRRPARGHLGPLVHHGIQRGPHIGPVEWQGPREHFEGGNGIGPPIRGGGGLTPHQQLRCCVRGGAEHHARLGQAGFLGPGDAEVHELQAPFPAHDHVVGLHVPVGDALVPRGLEGHGALDEQMEEALQIHALLRQVRQQGSIHVFHGHEGPYVGIFAHIEDGHDVGVVQPGTDLRLPLEAQQQRVSVLRQTVDDFHRHLALEQGIPGQVDHAHGAAAQHALDLVAANEGRGNGHGKGTGASHGTGKGDARRESRLGKFTFRP